MFKNIFFDTNTDNTIMTIEAAGREKVNKFDDIHWLYS